MRGSDPSLEYGTVTHQSQASVSWLFLSNFVMVSARHRDCRDQVRTPGVQMKYGKGQVRRGYIAS